MYAQCLGRSEIRQIPLQLDLQECKLRLVQPRAGAGNHTPTFSKSSKLLGHLSEPFSLTF